MKKYRVKKIQSSPDSADEVLGLIGEPLLYRWWLLTRTVRLSRTNRCVNSNPADDGLLRGEARTDGRTLFCG